MTKILIVTAVEAEREALLRGLSPAGQARVDVVAAGVGAAAAAVATAVFLAAAGTEGYRLVVSAGIGGAFTGRAEPGELLVADRILAADLGVQTGGGFASIDELGFGQSVECLAKPLLGLAGSFTGDLLTVNTATGTAGRARELVGRYPEAVGEAMEGYGVALAAQRFAVPAAELRAVSNLIGPRDRDAWEIPKALEALSAAAGPLVEEN
ncbi:MAG TPA: futalosine hydrolase [Actinocrinis sp.]|nr:futalosine hydrolase [Actinocrinis sp.]